MFRNQLGLLLGFALFFALQACDDGGSSAPADTCNAAAACKSTEAASSTACSADETDCREVSNECGEIYCRVDPTCIAPCPEGEFEVFEPCEVASECQTRMACGEEVTCRSTEACLATTRCDDMSVPRTEACPPEYHCLLQELCGQSLLCPQLSQCAQTACDIGETPSTMSCADTPNLCRAMTGCGEAFNCVCGVAALECYDVETLTTSPPCGNQELTCREVRGCNQEVYCRR
ncbi:MAG: hypothetical protein AUK47_08645 [Deltaproteobacteria bacterium CG2_30_63_29]|nr:MAG: hypothetical protein AUK47_08645 [Deltaproteobacteria bacterium CG2_30_63_29]